MDSVFKLLIKSCYTPFMEGEIYCNNSPLFLVKYLESQSRKRKSFLPDDDAGSGEPDDLRPAGVGQPAGDPLREHG
jgi:hypothetical protein